MSCFGLVACKLHFALRLGIDVPAHLSLGLVFTQGPFVLSMSPGFFGFYAHIGALIALEAEGLLEEVRCCCSRSYPPRYGVFALLVLLLRLVY